MNFKTTILLLLLLIGAGVYYFISQNGKPPTETSSTDQAKLLDIDAKDVTKVIVTPVDGPQYTLEKIGTDWQITEPVKAGAETFEMDSLIRDFTDAKTRGQVDAASNGLSKPHYQVQLVTASKTIKLAVGDKSAVGDNLYVQIDGESKANIIGTDLSDKLDKGVDSYRKMTLLPPGSDQIKQITVTRPEGKTVLQKVGEHWQMIEPVKEPIEDSAGSDLVFALTGLRAESFVDAKSLPATAIAHPQLTVSFTSAAPVLPPSPPPTTASVWTTVQFGAYDDILKKNVFVTIEGSGAVAKVASTALDSFKKKPLDIRDKKVIDLSSDQVTKLNVQTQLPATTQPVKPATDTNITIEKRKAESMGPPAPATLPATTQATTAPVIEKSKWIVSSENGKDADDTKVGALLTTLHPLTVDKYLESVPTTQPAGSYKIVVTTVAAGAAPVDNTITLIDPGHDQPLIGSYNGIAFEVSRSVLTSLPGEWKNK